MKKTNNLLQKLNYRSVRRKLNAIKVQKDYQQKKAIVSGFPLWAYIDVCNECILKCPLCPTGQGRRDRPQGKMSFAVFKKIMGEIGDYLYSINLDSWGEPFLNKEIFDIIHYASFDKSIKVAFGTNLNYFTSEMAEKLVDSGAEEVFVSQDGLDQETYQQYRQGGHLEKVIEHIRLIQEAKKRKNSLTPRIMMNFIVMRHNEGQLEEAKKNYAALGYDEFFLNKVYPNTGIMLYTKLEELLGQELNKRYLPANEELSYYDYAKKSRKKKFECRWLWEGVTVYWDGAVAPCCSVYEAEYNYGNILENSFKEIWNNSYYRSAREIIGRNINREPLTICHKCKESGNLG